MLDHSQCAGLVARFPTCGHRRFGFLLHRDHRWHFSFGRLLVLGHGTFSVGAGCSAFTATAAPAPAPASTPLLALRICRGVGVGNVGWHFLDHRCDGCGLALRRRRERRGGGDIDRRGRRLLGWPWSAVAAAIVAPFRFFSTLTIALPCLLLCVALARSLRLHRASILAVATLAVIAPPVAAHRLGLLLALSITLSVALSVALAVSTTIALFLIATTAVAARLASIVAR